MVETHGCSYACMVMAHGCTHACTIEGTWMYSEFFVCLQSLLSYFVLFGINWDCLLT